MQFPDVVVIDGLITGVVLGSPNGDDYRPDELWVATVDPMGVNQFTWIAKSRLTKKEPLAPPTPIVRREIPSEVTEMIKWIKHIAKVGFESCDQGTQEEGYFEIIQERLKSFFEGR